jgi:hypothetical protein
MLEGIRRGIWYGSDIGVEVVDTTWTDVGDVFQADGAKDDLVVACEEELLLSELHVYGIS